jgi:hypothetical protein
MTNQPVFSPVIGQCNITIRTSGRVSALRTGDVRRIPPPEVKDQHRFFFLNGIIKPVDELWGEKSLFYPKLDDRCMSVCRFPKNIEQTIGLLVFKVRFDCGSGSPIY